MVTVVERSVTPLGVEHSENQTTFLRGCLDRLRAGDETDPGREAAGDPVPEQADPAPGPGELAAWREFHEQAGALPAQEQEAFGLLWYQGLTPAEAAALLGVSGRTVRRRWQSACRK